MIEFEWDEAKALSNLRKHGIRFEDAVKVFSDPYAAIEPDEVDRGEPRWRTIGLIEGTLLILLVVYTSRELENRERVRIVSARQATRKEAGNYGKNRQGNAGSTSTDL